MKKLMLPLIVAASAVLSACTSIPQTLVKNVDATRLVVMAGVAKGAIEKGDASTWAARALIVRDAVSNAKGFLNGEAVTIPLLESAVRARLTSQVLSPTDRIIVDTAIDAALTSIRQQTGVTDDTVKLNETQLYQVGVVLGWIIDAAKLYE